MFSRLHYRNPTTAKHGLSYKHSVDENNLEETLQNLKCHYFNFVIAQCFEAFETFLKDVLSACLSTNSNNHIKVDDSINTESFETCRESISTYCRKGRNPYNKKLFELLYQINPKILESESQNLINFDFKEWYVVFSEIRHCIVHSNNEFNLTKSKNWTKFQKKVLARLFVAETENAYGQISTVAEYKYIIEIIAQHGQLIFDYLTTENENN